MSSPDEEPTQKPTTDRTEAERGNKWMGRNWLGIAAVSILGLVLLVVGMLQATGLVGVFAPVAESETQQWVAFGVLVLIWVALAGWSWTGISKSNQ
ncbi:hypothetical protein CHINAEXTREME_08595 [Halobiforma lacisalsi AJ5]|uniref:Uncharacterized protein n=1 Tax=Natronobacterium lacisalsi AJ5 TaxID=358396 RepID=M0LVA9_NATLA|nr:hypothetical protein [Halobiforma lacisalsi]APW97834.1 hypothetical protein CHINAEXTREME_08595 [Halobiforma lacisalsi AJ5]EMA37416.1 hypothetical protein C445_00966 [Halobiforma lacisalsi AJ5]